jgi:hypothetical protein
MKTFTGLCSGLLFPAMALAHGHITVPLSRNKYASNLFSNAFAGSSCSCSPDYTSYLTAFHRPAAAADPPT